MREIEAKQQRRIERLEHQNALMKGEIKKLCLKVDELEQEKYQTSVQIVGFPDVNEADDMKQVLKMTKDKLGIRIKANDIKAMTRLGKKQSGKTRNLNVTLTKKPDRNIYINDCLTKHRQSVLYTCRRQVPAKHIYAAWSQGGNILIRREEHGNITQIHNHEDLRNILSSDMLEQDNAEDKTSTSNTSCSFTLTGSMHIIIISLSI